jgi:acetoin:2,6-dichlorophenolindophenol oxidoreductase subunit beta
MTITYLEAIREAQEKALRDDQRVYIYGHVGASAAPLKATKNLAKQFPGRILDAPISEDAMVGSAIEGLRPIIEMQFADFSAVAFNQIVNQADTLFWGIQVACDYDPVAIGWQPGKRPFHSQCLESLYSHFPGLVVMTPTTVENAYTMLLEAVEIDDPVIFCEHKYLYNRLKSDALPETNLPYDTARVARRSMTSTSIFSLCNGSAGGEGLVHHCAVSHDGEVPTEAG